jgi:hypothetical protein
VVRDSSVTFLATQLGDPSASQSQAALPSMVDGTSCRRAPPISACSSTSITGAPPFDAASAAASPAGPAPITSTSQCAWRC